MKLREFIADYIGCRDLAASSVEQLMIEQLKASLDRRDDRLVKIAERCEIALGAEFVSVSAIPEAIDKLGERIAKLQSQLTQARERLAKIVVVDGEDAGVVLLSSDGPTHLETRTIDGIERKVGVYDHEYFSPLGDALVEIYEGLK